MFTLFFCVCCSYQLVALKGPVFTQSCSSHWRRSILLDVTSFKSFCCCFFFILFVKSERCYLVTIGYWNQRRDIIVDSRTFLKRKEKKNGTKSYFIEPNVNVHLIVKKVESSSKRSWEKHGNKILTPYKFLYGAVRVVVVICFVFFVILFVILPSSSMV